MTARSRDTAQGVRWLDAREKGHAWWVGGADGLQPGQAHGRGVHGGAGRRGVGVTVLLEKIAGAHAEAGGTLAEVAATAEKVNANVRSMGMALTSCIVPAAGTPTFDLPEDEMEIGIGIHGEPGRRRLPLAPADEITRLLAEPVIDDLLGAYGPTSAKSTAA